MLLERDEMDHTHTHTHATTGVGDEEAMVVVDVKQNPLFFFLHGIVSALGNAQNVAREGMNGHWGIGR